MVETSTPTSETATAEQEVASFGRTKQRTFNLDTAAVGDVLDEDEETEVVDPKEENPKEETAEAKIEEPKETEKKETEKPAKEEKEEAGAELTEEQIKAFMQKNGIEFDTIDSLKEKLTPKNTPSAEDIKQRELALDKRYADIYVGAGGTVDQYVQLKGLAKAPLVELSTQDLKHDLLKSGLTEEEVNSALKDSFYQYSEEDLEDYDEDAKADILKKKEAFTTVLEKISEYKQKTAQNILASLEKEANELDRLTKEEELLSAKIDEHSTTLPRKLTFNLGESNGKPISPIDYEVSEKQVKEVTAELKEYAKTHPIFTTSEGEINLKSIEDYANLLIRNKVLETAVKAAYHEGGSRQAQIIAEQYGANPFEIGIGGAPDKGHAAKGTPASFGKTRRLNFSASANN